MFSCDIIRIQKNERIDFMANIIDDRDMYIEAGIAEYIKDHDIKITDIIDNKSGKAVVDKGEKKGENLQKGKAYLQKLYDYISQL